MDGSAFQRFFFRPSAANQADHRQFSSTYDELDEVSHFSIQRTSDDSGQALVRAAIPRLCTFWPIPALIFAVLVYSGCASTALNRERAPAAAQQGSVPSAQSSPTVSPPPKLPADATGQSRVLTAYLKDHRLPLVGANVVGSGNDRQIILYGFVATPHGKTDAEDQVRKIVNDPQAKIVDRIIMRPELLTMNNTGGPSAGGSNTPGTDRDILDRVATSQSQTAPEDVMPYQNQKRSGWADLAIAILMIAPMFIP
jgi:hypothetical protein